MRARNQDYVVKAGGPANHHIGREITAHEAFTTPLTNCARAARLVAADRDARVLVLDYLSGQLVEGSEHELLAETYVQAGKLLAAFHSQALRIDDDYERRTKVRALSWLDGEHRIDPEIEGAARRILGAYDPVPVDTVPTHGDWQPRNWIIDRGFVKVIDFGRFDFRSPASDLCRLAAQQWRGRPELEAAFLSGYGEDPRDPGRWPIDQLQEAIGTAAWAYRIGDFEFEAQGHRMLREAIERF